MTQTASHVLKAPQVHLAGPRTIGSPAAGLPAATPMPTARILEQSDGRAVIEVTCPCGRVTQLACTFDPTPRGENPTP